MGISIVANQSSVHKVLSVIIEFAKRKDGNTVLRCIRDDGSSTWQRNENQHARFFPLHDLTHYAVESELGFSHGFFGLIAAGWNIDETTGKSARGALPHEALEVEHFVSSLMAEWNSETEWSASDFNAQSATFAESRRLPAPRTLTDEELARVRSCFKEVCARWRDLPEGETLRLELPLL
ncbi:MAG: hypothetical protein ABR611_01330 [Chthoniobacterales bacterium]